MCWTIRILCVLFLPVGVHIPVRCARVHLLILFSSVVNSATFNLVPSQRHLVLAIFTFGIVDPVTCTVIIYVISGYSRAARARERHRTIIRKERAKFRYYGGEAECN
eukprot:SAG11_NODE_1149_length_5682_cov_5.991401_5_plen_107_part_00